MKNCRVAVFRSNLLPVSETFIRDQVIALREWQPILIGFRRIPNGLEMPDIPYEIIDARGRRALSTYHYWLSRPIPALINALRRLQIDLVHAHFGYDATDIWPTVKAAGLPMLVTLHGKDINVYREWWEAGHGGLRRRVYPRRLLKMARDSNVRFLAVSHTIRDRAIAYGIPEDKLSVCHIGVNRQRFSPGSLPLARRPKRILFVGRMVEKKAPLLMVRAFAETRIHVQDAELVMIGDGPLLARAKALASELAAPVEFMGACNSDQVLEQMHQARVFCLPSVTANNGDAEGLPISILEAMACGVPVVTSANGALDAIRPWESGMIHAENDLFAMSDMITTVLRDCVLAERLAQEALITVQSRFDIFENGLAQQEAYTACRTSR